MSTGALPPNCEHQHQDQRDHFQKPVKPQSHTRDNSPSSGSESSRRPSFGSIKEDSTEIAQTFVDTEDNSSSNQPRIASNPATRALVQSPDSPEFCCPCGAFLGWKQIRLGGRRQSRSYSDLRLLGNAQSRGFAWEVNDATRITPVAEEPKKSVKKGQAPIELLPAEILDQIISHLAIDIPPNGYTPRNVDLVSCLLTSRTLHSATLSVLYRHITIPHSIIFSKALNHIKQYPALGTIVRRLDFSHFTSVGLGRTQQMNVEIQNVTSKTLLECLELLTNLKECLLQEHLEDDLNVDVLRKLLSRTPSLRAVDFCGCSSSIFSDGFLNAVTEDPDFPATLPSLRRVSLHECSGLVPPVFETLLPRLVNVTHLDVCHTQITNSALMSIPHSARITHLNISRCTKLTGPEVVKFLTTHPAVRESLVYLNVMTDSSRHQLLDETDVDNLLPCLTSTLRSVNLGGAKIRSSNMPSLLRLSKHVEELGLDSANLTISDINLFFALPPSDSDSDSGSNATSTTSTSTSTNGNATGNANNTKHEDPSAHRVWVPSQLCYLDLTKNPHVTQAALLNPKACLLVTPHSAPLDVIELSEKIISPLRQRSRLNKYGNGWLVRDLGRRGWYVRGPALEARQGKLAAKMDDGRRPWKMGARWWGMRKIPVAVGDVGGLYGHYMFKK
ncbi:leucine rich repeat domain-containing protein [Histoplasma capsulatum G186AR]|uniref:Leucine rich repeat domain-containing protein n=2 Tax=Ajellomyces capsulatus TaxID=5037 RepID=C0NJP9_AJECG|nr:leucine rich repeat domain-containing protein [Histoplasma capsulatum G186AR]EEH08090.1 leucine rich repeat domain-containing protein [Histoplasma capsulatum G186AR]KAG5299585.1 leucine rich repeat domain-containing protein [Histoplasma capsulatum]QSS67789.1 leucine rich repeat domain-containing protein [Histoplasma capsulatum G186AR]